LIVVVVFDVLLSTVVIYGVVVVVVVAVIISERTVTNDRQRFPLTNRFESWCDTPLVLYPLAH
jgi:hypothetical protein